jgi:hypothetical protein
MVGVAKALDLAQDGPYRLCDSQTHTGECHEKFDAGFFGRCRRQLLLLLRDLRFDSGLEPQIAVDTRSPLGI